MGQHNVEWLTARLQDSAKHDLPGVPNRHPYQISPYGGMYPLNVVDPKHSHDAAIVVSRLVAPPRPGTYRLLLCAHVQYGDYANSADKATPALNAEQTLMLRVKAPIAQHLQQIALDWKDKILSDQTDWRDRSAAVDALLSIPDTAALPVWHQLMQSFSFNNNMLLYSHAVERFSQLGTRAAAEVLFDNILREKPESDSYREVQDAIAAIYTANAPEVRDYLEQRHLAEFRQPSVMFANIRAEERKPKEKPKEQVPYTITITPGP